MEKNDSTKWRIFETAIHMFSDVGFEQTSMRDLSDKLGIKPAALYNHFKSKDDILKSICEFYEYHHKKIVPDMEKILKGAETEDVYKLLSQSDVYYDPDIEELMIRILVIICFERRTDKRCQELIIKYQYQSIRQYFYPLLNKLIELKRIEPLDVETFISLYFSFCHGAILRKYSGITITVQEWENCLKMIYSLIKPK